MPNPSPFRFRKTGEAAYAVTDAETGAELGTATRTTPAWKSLSATWSAKAPDGTKLGQHHRTRGDAARTLRVWGDRPDLHGVPGAPADVVARGYCAEAPADVQAAAVATAVTMLGAQPVEAPADVPVSNELRAELVADARAAHATGRPAAPTLSDVVRRAIDGLPVGTQRTREVFGAWSGAYEDARAEAEESDAMRCDVFGHEPGDVPGRCGACGGPYAPVPPLEIGPVSDSFHDPRADCCGRDAADCDCPRCERCGALYDPERAGTDDDAGLCADCAARNDGRVVL